MAHTINPRAKDAILSILLEVKQAGIGKITRTALIKYLYLLDYWTAEETGGEIFTGTEWRFHHFGPYSDVLAADIDWLSTQPSVEKEESTGKSVDYFLYSLGEWAKAQTFESLGLPITVRLNLIEAIKHYSGDLNGLLGFVYFKTEPMQRAKPGDILSFAGLHKLNFKTDIKQIRVPVTDVAKIDRIKSLLAKIGDQWNEGHVAFTMTQPPLRDALFAGVSEDEGLDGIEGNYISRLTFYGEAS